MNKTVFRLLHFLYLYGYILFSKLNYVNIQNLFWHTQIDTIPISVSNLDKSKSKRLYKKTVPEQQ